MDGLDLRISEVMSILSRMLGQPVTTLERISGGKNSKVYWLTCGGSNHYAVKFYFRHEPDGRDRLGAEFSGLKFLWDNGVRCIPQPIVADKDLGCAVYEYIEGTRIPSEEVTDSNIDNAIEFLMTLEALKSREGSDYLPPAAEACFSAQALVNNIEQRFDRLVALRNYEVEYVALHGFLTDEFMPTLNEIAEWCRSSLNQRAMSFLAELPYEERTLSPSDFGFHNALKRSNGQIVFLDFEYFGWDDPAKMISDFLLHPAMELREGLRHRFAASIMSHLESRERLAGRLEAVYPLFGLKWCLILLNEFAPEHLSRRQFASVNDFDKGVLQAEQLVKARRMLDRVRRDYQQFPYLV